MPVGCKGPGCDKRIEVYKIYCGIGCELADERRVSLKDFAPIKPDGVDYTGTDHDQYYFHSNPPKETSSSWADIISGKCKCKQCEQARFAHTVKQMVAEEKKLARERKFIIDDLSSR